MGIFNSKADGSLKSVSEQFAFPYKVANANHISYPLHNHKNNKKNINLFFAKIEPSYYDHIPIRKILIFSHGNCMTVDQSFIHTMQKIAEELGVTIYLPEYPGYGEAENIDIPTADTCANTLKYMVEYVLKYDNCSVDKIYIAGHSIGTGVVVRYVTDEPEHRFAGIILISPYKSVLKVVSNNDTSNSMCSSFDFYRTEHCISDIEAPVCLIHGEKDDVIAVEHSDDLYDNLNKKYENQNVYYRLKNGDHNMIIDTPQLRQCMKKFIWKKR